MAWQVPAGRTEGKEGQVLAMKTRTCNLGRIQGIVQTYADRIRKARSQMELNLGRDIKNNKKRFCRYIGQNRQAKGSVPPLTREKGEPSTTDKAEVLDEFFASDFIGCQDSHIFRVPEPHTSEPWGGNQGSKVPLTVRTEQVQDCLMRLNLYKSIGLDCMHPGELADVDAEPPLKSCGSQVEFPVTAEREKSLSFIRRGGRKTWGTTD